VCECGEVHACVWVCGEAPFPSSYPAVEPHEAGETKIRRCEGPTHLVSSFFGSVLHDGEDALDSHADTDTWHSASLALLVVDQTKRQ
jgi:hypothetical protein